jgi:23S rRNA pseudouridine955/2504/2580 synthase
MSDKKLLRQLENLEIEADRAGQRLDNFLLGRLKGIPRSVIYRILRTGQVRVNKGRVKPQYKLQAGDQLRIPPVYIQPAIESLNESKHIVREVGQRLHKAILFENEQIVVLNKPSGLAVHGGSGLKYGLIEIMKAYGHVYDDLELVHRLDRATSGCLLLAKNYHVLRQLHELLRQHSVEKSYQALLQGKLRKPISVNAALSRSKRGGERVVNIDEEGKTATTHISPKQCFKEATLAEIQIDTGRTHQIRVHCASINHALAGDEKYGDREFNKSLRKTGLKRLFLHASSLRFTTDQSYFIQAPLPEDLTEVLEKLND